jgi:hypothetical protein
MGIVALNKYSTPTQTWNLTQTASKRPSHPICSRACNNPTITI